MSACCRLGLVEKPGVGGEGAEPALGGFFLGGDGDGGECGGGGEGGGLGEGGGGGGDNGPDHTSSSSTRHPL